MIFATCRASPSLYSFAATSALPAAAVTTNLKPVNSGEKPIGQWRLGYGLLSARHKAKLLQAHLLRGVRENGHVQAFNGVWELTAEPDKNLWLTQRRVAVGSTGQIWRAAKLSRGVINRLNVRQMKRVPALDACPLRLRRFQLNLACAPVRADKAWGSHKQGGPPGRCGAVF